MTVDLAVATPTFLDLTFVGLEGMPASGEERFAADLVRSPGGGAITAVGAARLGLSTALAAPLGDDDAGDFVRAALQRDGVATSERRSPAHADDRRHAGGRRSLDDHGRPGRARERGRRRAPRAARGRAEPRPALLACRRAPPPT